MLFNSLTFLIFLPIVLVGYWWLCGRSYKWQNVWLLIASYVFYAWWDWRCLFLIIGVSLVNFLAGWFIAESQNKFLRRSLLTLCCLSCLGILGAFKYYNFFVESLLGVYPSLGQYGFSTIQIILPVGISFFTFQALSYTIDISLGKIKPTKDFVEFFVFIAFFPLLVAGPIERASNLLPQFQRSRKLTAEPILHGICLVAYGLFKKMVVADTLALYVNGAFNNCVLYSSSMTCLLGAFFFSIQIYCDFSGYSDVARGVSKFFGIEAMLNFDRPYLSRSIAEFWRRWHISLSTWFKDYVYIPLGGNRVGDFKFVRNIWIVFLLSGLWHGAAWTFIIWGALHAVYQTLGWLRMRLFGKSQPSQHKLAVLRDIVVVNFGVMFAWIFFRAQGFAQVSDYLQTLFTGGFRPTLMALCAGQGPMVLVYCCLAVLLLAMSYWMPRDCQMKTYRGYTLFASACILAIIFFGQPTGGEFIYFQF